MVRCVARIVTCVAVVLVVLGSGYVFAQAEAPEVPAAVTNALKAEFPNLAIVKPRLVGKEGAQTWSVSLVSEDKKSTAQATVTPEGVIVNITVPVAQDQVPAPVMATINQNLGGGAVKSIARKEQRTGKGGAKLDAPVVTYAVTLAKEGGATGMMTVAADGALQGEVKWREPKPKTEKPAE